MRLPGAFAYLIQEYRAAARNVTRQYRRSLFGVIAVAFGVVALVLATGFVEWIFWATREGTIQNGLGHVHVVRDGYLEHGQADPFEFLVDDGPAELGRLAVVPGLKVIAPRLAFNGMISHGEHTLSFLGEGVDPEAERVLSRAMIVAEGSVLSGASDEGILLGRGLAENLGVRVGDRVVLLANTAAGGLNAVEAVVAGLFTTVSKAYDDSAARMPLALAQRLLRTEDVHRLILVLDDTARTPAVLESLRAGHSGSGLVFVPWYEMADFYSKLVSLLSRQMGVVQTIIGIIIVLSISNIMMMNVFERTAEIGTCMAIGRTRRQILRQFLFEGLTIGLTGAAMGAILGVVGGFAISWVGIPMPPPPGMSESYRGEILVTVSLLVQALGLALVTTLAASAYPAWKASRLEIVDALRHNR